MAYELSDPVIICPYDKNHLIARSRIQRHLVKCEKNYPPGYKQECPYDATHRVFESEMIEHVENCQMRFTFENSSKNLGRLPEIEEPEVKLENDEVWDEDTATPIDNPFNEPVFDTINFTNRPSRGKSIMKRFHSTLRAPFGYPESMMLETSNQETDDDTQSITSDMGVGRGQTIIAHLRGQRGSHRGLRGRLIL